MPNETSNQDLLEAINSGFNGVQKQFDGMQKQFDGVNNQLKELRQGQENLELKMTNVAYRFELQEVQARIKVLEDKLDVKYK